MRPRGFRIVAVVRVDFGCGLANHEWMWLDLDDEIGMFPIVVEADVLALEF